MNLLSIMAMCNQQSSILSYQGNGAEVSKFNYVYLRYIQTHDVLPLLRGVCPNCEWVINHSHQSVGVRAPEKKWTKIKAAIQKMDKRPPQVRLNLEIIEVSNIKSERYQQLYASLSEPTVLNQDVESIIQMMVSSGNAKIVSSPQLVGTSGSSIHLLVGEKIPYINSIETNGGRTTQLNYIDSGIKLEILPFVHYNHYVGIKIKLNYNTISGYRTESGMDLPILATRSSELNLQLNQGEPILFAGLIDESQHTSTEKVPFLGDIPWLGELFKRRVIQKKTTDLIFKISNELIK